ncbi:MAG: tRNA (adenosine(37)-N6)-threonylcarbamoyltransferase complex dimerization subunit type 1 TsaB [Acidimicrobiales bacterium]
MRVLAIETATSSVGCALWVDGAVVGASRLMASRRHAEVLMATADELCRRAGLAPAQLDGVAVDVGPGLFTGLRVGLAAAGALAAARDLPSAGVTSLETVAYPQRHRPGMVAAILDARRGEVYFALYESDGVALEERRPPSVASPGEVAGVLAGLAGRPLAVGEGAWRYRAALGETGAQLGGPAEMWPSPEVVAELGARRLEHWLGVGERVLEDGASLGGLLRRGAAPAALYLRQADVRIGWEQVGGRVGPAGDGAGQGAQAKSGRGAGGGVA